MPRGTKPETIGFIVGYSIAILVGFVRLAHRLHRRQLWWDDLWALVAVFFTIFNLIIYLLLNLPENVIGLYSETASSFMLWTSFQFQPAIVWATRLSIQVTVIRFLLPGNPYRLVSKFAFTCLLAMWAVVAISKIFYCGTPVPKLPVPPCIYAKWPSVIALVFDVISTSWLVGWPIFILIRMKLSRPGRKLIIACFSLSLLLGAMDIFHAVNLILGVTKTLNISGHLEIMIALILCNILVLVTYFYRVFRDPSEDSDDEDSSDGCETTRSKRERQVTAESHRRDSEMSQRLTPGQQESSIGPLTTVYSSSGDYSGVDFSAGLFSSHEQTGSVVTNPTSPPGSQVSSKI